MELDGVGGSSLRMMMPRGPVANHHPAIEAETCFLPLLPRPHSYLLYTQRVQFTQYLSLPSILITPSLLSLLSLLILLLLRRRRSAPHNVLRRFFRRSLHPPIRRISRPSLLLLSPSHPPRLSPTSPHPAPLPHYRWSALRTPPPILLLLPHHPLPT